MMTPSNFCISEGMLVKTIFLKNVLHMEVLVTIEDCSEASFSLRIQAAFVCYYLDGECTQ